MYFCFEAEKSTREEVLALEACAPCSVNGNTKEQPQELALLPAAGDTRVSLSHGSVSSRKLLLGGRPNPMALRPCFCHSSLVTIERERRAVVIDNLKIYQPVGCEITCLMHVMTAHF